ncbi:MAG: FtsX-like permease family protein [Ktedonobacterales bacterium]
MSASLKKSFADVTRRKGRTLLVVLGIFIGVFGLTAINITQDQLFAAFAFTVGNQTTRPDLILDVDRLDPALLSALQAIPNVKAVQYETTLETQWHVTRAPGHVDFTITSYPDLQQIPLTPFELVSGHYPGVGEIVMEYGDVAIQPAAIGEMVTVDTAQGTARLRVVGLVRTPGVNPATTDNALGYMSDAALQSLPAFTDPITAPPLAPLRIQHIAIKVANITQVDTTARALGNLLRAHQVMVLGTSFPEPLTAQLQQVEGIFTLVRILAVVAVVMSGILLLNTVITLVAEQTAIIGTLKALGGTRGVILRGYLLSIGLYSLLATVPGLVLGVLGGAQLATVLGQAIPLAPGPVVVAPGLIALSLALGFGVPLLAALWPLWNGTRISVRAALSAYGISAASGNRLLVWLGGHFAWISQTTWLGLRSPFRKRARAALTLLMLTVAGTSFLVVQTASASVNETVGSVWANIHANVEVYADEPYSQARTQLGTLSNVSRMERFGIAGGQTPWGKLAIWGFESGTRIYRYQLTSGRWLREDDTNVVLLSDAVVAKTGLHLGSRLVVTSLGGHSSATWTVIGTLHEPVDSLGQIGAAVVPVTTLYEFEGVPAATAADYTNKLLIQAKDRTPQAVNQLADRIDATGTNLILSGALPRGGGLGPVFLVQDEAVRHQRDFYVVYALLYAVALLIGVAGILGLASALTASVTERQREIGLLRAMGATNWRIAQVFWVEGLALGSIAWGFGALLGLPLAAAFVKVLSQLVVPTDFIIDPLAFVVMLGTILGMVTLASIVPAFRAARVRIVGLLRYE